MSSDEGKQEKIARLLRDGLDHYGVGKLEQAQRCWNEVLLLDPVNAEALEYLETATSEGDEAAPAAGGSAGHNDLASLVQDARRLMREGHLEAALELFETVSRREPDRLEVQGYVEMVRSRLVQRYRERLGDLKATLRLRVSTQDVMKFNLPAAAGFMLSLVDGVTTLNELVSLSGMDTFETLRILTSLLDAGIVTVHA